MKILVFGINYAPELTGIGKYTGEMCEWLAAKGHHVEVITTMPYYPQWEVADAYKGRVWHKEFLNGVIVRRCPVYVPSSQSGKARILQDLSFLFSSLWFWIPTFFKKHDHVICIAPAFSTGIYGVLYKWISGCRMQYHIQDLQVDAAERMGLISSNFLLKILKGTERWIIKNADIVSSISEGMRRNIVKKCALKQYLSLPNWTDTDFIQPLPRSEEMLRRLGLNKDDKIVLYSGNIGEKQGLDLVVEVADELRDDSSVKFVLIGEGAYKTRLKEKVEAKKLTNVLFFPLQPYEEMAALLSIGDVHLVLQKKSATDLVMPSKLINILAAGGLVLASSVEDTSLYDVITQHNIGIMIPPEDASALHEAIKGALYNDHNAKRKNARSFAEEELNIDRILAKFDHEITRKDPC